MAHEPWKAISTEGVFTKGSEFVKNSTLQSVRVLPLGRGPMAKYQFCKLDVLLIIAKANKLKAMVAKAAVDLEGTADPMIFLATEIQQAALDLRTGDCGGFNFKAALCPALEAALLAGEPLFKEALKTGCLAITAGKAFSKGIPDENYYQQECGMDMQTLLLAKVGAIFALPTLHPSNKAPNGQPQIVADPGPLWLALWFTECPGYGWPSQWPDPKPRPKKGI